MGHVPVTTSPEGIPEPPIALILAIAVASCLAGGTLVFFDSEICVAIMTQLLNPGTNTVSGVAERANFIFDFQLALFLAGSQFIGVPLVAAWFGSNGYKQYVRTVVLIFASSILVSSAAF
jgi:hypothetical protein